MRNRFVFSPEVATALEHNRPIVALESTIISHGLPRPQNLVVAREFEQVVRDNGATPATIAVVDGQVRIGLDDKSLDTIANGDVTKVGIRDLAGVIARGQNGATTVAATSHLANEAGIKVFATGGLGGVHRGARDTWDESADLTALGALPITVVSAGVKSILDVQATLERLETLNVAVLCLGTDVFPGFYLKDSGFAAPWRVDSESQVADFIKARNDIGVDSAVVVAVPPIRELDRNLHDTVLSTGLATAEASHVVGKDVTPFLLEYFHTATKGQSLEVNVELVKNNAAVASQIAAHLS